jgi:hypothetical protein
MSETPGEERKLVDEWLSTRSVYDLRIDSAVATPHAGGGFDAELRVSAVSVSQGDSTSDVPLERDHLDLAIFDDASPRNQIYSGQLSLIEGRGSLRIHLPVRPGRIVLDPLVRRLDRDRSNNAKHFVFRSRPNEKLEPDRSTSEQ